MAKKKPKAGELEPMNPDSEAVYDAQISPLMTQIIDICKRHRIPMVASFQWADDTHADGAGFCTTRIPFEGEHANLARAAVELLKKPTFVAFTITTEKAGG